MSKEKFFLGAPVEFKPGIKIYPPTVHEVITNDYYSLYGRLLTYSQEEVEDEFLEENKSLEKYPTPIEYLLNNSYHNKNYEKLCRDSFKFFLHSEVTFLYEQKMIVIGDINKILTKLDSLDNLIILKEEDFFDF
jgi:hypothetical protein